MSIRFLVGIILFLIWAFPALADEDFLVLDDPRKFLGECSFETATSITFEEAALNYEGHLGDCVEITGYYSLALYDGVEGFYQTDGDDWYHVPSEILERYRIGLYFPIDHDPRFLAETQESWKQPEMQAYWSQTFGADNFKRRTVTLGATLYSCEKWLQDSGKTNLDQNFIFEGFCFHQTGAIVVVHD